MFSAIITVLVPLLLLSVSPESFSIWKKKEVYFGKTNKIVNKIVFKKT